MDSIKDFVKTTAVVFALVLGARATVLPRTFADEEILVPAGHFVAKCFVFNTTNRKMVVALESENSAPVRAAIVEGGLLDLATSGRADLLELASQPEARTPALISGTLSSYATADTEWCFVAEAPDGPAQLQYTVKTYVRF